MATPRQSGFLKDLGIDPRVYTDDVAKDEATARIAELLELAQRASLPKGRPLTVGVVEPSADVRTLWHGRQPDRSWPSSRNRPLNPQGAHARG